MQEPLILLCLPCAGASATSYLRWRRSVPAWLRIAPIELPGRGARMGEALQHDYAGLVEQLCIEHDATVRGPYALFGHSMGALLAHGMTRWLHAHGRSLPHALLVAGSPAPSLREPARTPGDPGDTDRFFIAELRRQGGTPEALFAHPEMLRMTIDVMAADYRVCASHRHQPMPPLPVPIHAFAGRGDNFGVDRLMPWAQETHAGLTLDWFEGGHFFVQQQSDEVLSAMCRHLREDLPAHASAPDSGPLRATA